MVPYRHAIRITPVNNTLHVVSENVFGYAKTLKRVDHANKEILLHGIREKLYVAPATVMAYHRKTGSTIDCAIATFHIDETPVHLVHLTWAGPITTRSVSLRCYSRSWDRYKIFVILDVLLDLGLAAGITKIHKALEDNNRVGHRTPEQVVDVISEARQNVILLVSACVPVRLYNEAVLLQIAQLLTRDASSTSKFCEIDIEVGVVLTAGFFLHLFNSLCYILLQAIAFINIHNPPMTLIHQQHQV